MMGDGSSVAPMLQESLAGHGVVVSSVITSVRSIAAWLQGIASGSIISIL